MDINCARCGKNEVKESLTATLYTHYYVPIIKLVTTGINQM